MTLYKGLPYLILFQPHRGFEVSKYGRLDFTNEGNGVSGYMTCPRSHSKVEKMGTQGNYWGSHLPSFPCSILKCIEDKEKSGETMCATIPKWKSIFVSSEKELDNFAPIMHPQSSYEIVSTMRARKIKSVFYMTDYSHSTYHSAGME